MGEEIEAIEAELLAWQMNIREWISTQVYLISKTGFFLLSLTMSHGVNGHKKKMFPCFWPSQSGDTFLPSLGEHVTQGKIIQKARLMPSLHRLLFRGPRGFEKEVSGFLGDPLNVWDILIALLIPGKITTNSCLRHPIFYPELDSGSINAHIVPSSAPCYHFFWTWHQLCAIYGPVRFIDLPKKSNHPSNPPVWLIFACQSLLQNRPPQKEKYNLFTLALRASNAIESIHSFHYVLNFMASLKMKTVFR